MEIVEELAEIGPRGACGDGERRAALALRDRLRRRGRPARIETAWVRPGWPWLYALLCALGAGASLLALAQPEVALAILVVVLVALAGDAGGWAPFARLLLPRRATQCVVSEPPPRPGRPRLRLIVTAAYDAPLGGLARRLAPVAARLRLPSGPALLCAALALLAALTAARVAGVEDRWVDLVAIAPTVALLLGAGLALDTALAGTSEGADANAGATAAALAAVADLDRLPPSNLAVELVLAGAGEAGRLGFRDYVRRRRRAARPRELAVVAIGATGAGPPRHHRCEGVLPPRRAHPGLLAVADPAHRARHGGTAAADALRAGWPAIGLSGSGARDLVERASTQAMAAYAANLVRALDRRI